MNFPKRSSFLRPMTNAVAFSVFLTPVFAISVAEKSSQNSPEAEKATFELADGIAVNLFASEEDGIANPIAMNWDAAGRLWVLTTLAYAQVEPGGATDDRLLVLEDTDGDGKADKTSVWADNLSMPTGFALGHGGVYLAEEENLLFLRDTDGDGRADSRKVLLSGFGTGDTHQNINSLSWGPAGDLWFCQGLHNFSRVETPWGIVRGEEAGFWRLRVRDLKLEPFCMPSMAAQNPWGVNWDRWGAMFVKSNNTQLGYVSPGIIPTTHYLELMRRATVATTPGKSMGCEIVESSLWPDLEDHVLIAGYFSNRVTAFPLEPEGAGFKETKGTELLVSTHPSFRPVEVKVGPDGAIYVADWFNPIIGHYQASLRHPDRDVSHGRIWRLTAKDRDLVESPDLMAATATELLETHLQSRERWVRYQARRRFADLEEVEPADIVSANAQHLLENIWARESRGFEAVGEAEVKKLVTFADSAEVRAYGARMIGRWAGQLTDPLALLKLAVADESPRVRLEAVVAASHLNSATAMSVALKALDLPRDKHLDYALIQCVHALRDHWMLELEAGDWKVESPVHLAFAVQTAGGKDAAELVRSLANEAGGETQTQLILALARVGGPSDLDFALKMRPVSIPVLEAVRESVILRNVRPSGEAKVLLDLAISSGTGELQIAALELATEWGEKTFRYYLPTLAGDLYLALDVREAVIRAVGRLEERESAIEQLDAYAKSGYEELDVRIVACAELARLDLAAAAEISAFLLKRNLLAEDAKALLAPYLAQEKGSETLVTALKRRKLEEPQVRLLAQAMAAAGRADPSLTAYVNDALGIESSHVTEFDTAWVAALVQEVEAQGNGDAGAKVFALPQLGCVACHVIDGNGGSLGPDLSTVGAGVPVSLLVEAVLWPERQLKEGYFSISVKTKTGRIFNGYREREEAGILWLREAVTGKVERIRRSEIVERNDIGTLMPKGLTASLSREELRDLIRYLSERR